MEMSSSISADLYIDHIIGLGMKNYPKLTLHLLKSIQWLPSYVKIFLNVRWCVHWPHHWIWHEKLPQIDPSYVEIPPLVAKLWGGLLPCQLTSILTSPLDWAWKTTPKWPLICLIPCIGFQVTWRLSSMSADLYSDLTIGLGMKNYPKMTPHKPYSMHWFPSYMKVIFHVSWFVHWPHHWTGHEKLPHIDPSHVEIHPLE